MNWAEKQASKQKIWWVFGQAGPSLVSGRSRPLSYISENQSECNLPVTRLASGSQFGPCGAKVLTQEDKDINTRGCLAAGDVHIAPGVGGNWGVS